MPNFPNDPYDPYRSGPSSDPDRPERFDTDLQDPELQQGPASTSKIVLFAVGLALVLGAVFYGLNNTSVKEAQTTPPAQTAQTQNNGSQAPKANDQPGMTTGSATTRPETPQSAPQGNDINRSTTPPAKNK